MIVQPAMLCGMETVPVTSSHVNKLEVTEMKMCRWAYGHTLRDHVRNENIKDRLTVSPRLIMKKKIIIILIICFIQIRHTDDFPSTGNRLVLLIYVTIFAIMNFSICERILKKNKHGYSSARKLFIISDFSWTNPFVRWYHLWHFGLLSRVSLLFRYMNCRDLRVLSSHFVMYHNV